MTDWSCNSTPDRSATTTQTFLPAPGGGTVAAATLQTAVLAALADVFAVIADNAAAIPD